jgi:hypothetical protein
MKNDNFLLARRTWARRRGRTSPRCYAWPGSERWPGRRCRCDCCSCCRCRRGWLVSEGTGDFRRTPNMALKSASGDVHDVETLHDRRRIKVEDYEGRGEDVTIRRDSINHEIGGLDSARICRIAQLNIEIHRLCVDHTVTTWASDVHNTRRGCRCWAWRYGCS